MTIVMGVVGRYPFALADRARAQRLRRVLDRVGMSWPDAMGLVVLEGLVITVLVLTGFRTAVFRRRPGPAKTAIASASACSSR